MSPLAAVALPFTRAEFLDQIAAYNRAVWPAQVVLHAAALATVALTWVDRGWARGSVWIVLGGLWLWTGLGYHALYFAAIDPAAWGFAALFVVEAGLLFLVGLGERPRDPRPPLSVGLGGLVIAYALVGYPLIGWFSDHRYPAQPTFGLPCPTTIFTFGVVLLTRQPVPGWLLLIPALWALIGATTPVALGIWEDFGLIVAAIIAVASWAADSRRGAARVRLAS